MRQWITPLDKHIKMIAREETKSVKEVTNLEKNKDLEIILDKAFIFHESL